MFEIYVGIIQEKGAILSKIRAYVLILSRIYSFQNIIVFYMETANKWGREY